MKTVEVQVTNKNAMAQKADAARRACAVVMEEFMKDLPSAAYEVFGQVVIGGGSVGLEILHDSNMAPTLSVVAVEREGARHVLARLRGQPA